MLQLTDSVLAVAALGAARGLPMLLMSYVGGILADRVSRLRILRISQSLSLAIVSAYALYLLLSTPLPWTAHITIGLIGTVWSFDFANRRSLYTEMFEPKDLVTAIPVDTITFTVGLTVGPLFAGYVTRNGGFAVAYVVLAIMHAISLVLLPSNQREQERLPSMKRVPIRDIIRSGMTTLRKQRVLQAIVAVTFVANFFGFPFHQMVPVIGRTVLSADALHVGMLASAWGIGALVGAIAMVTRATRRPAWIFAAGMSTLFICIGIFALSSTYIVSFGFLLIGGVGFSGFAAMQVLLTLSTAMPTLRGRSMGIVGLAIGMQPFGVISLGLFAKWIGPQKALASFALAGLCALALVRWRYPEIGWHAKSFNPPAGR